MITEHTIRKIIREELEKSSSDIPELMTTEDLAAALRMSPRSLDRWRADGVGPASKKIGGRVLFDKRVVDEWINNQQ